MPFAETLQILNDSISFFQEPLKCDHVDFQWQKYPAHSWCFVLFWFFFFPKPSQEKTHKYSSKQVTYFPADMHFAFPCFHSIFPIHTVHIVIGKTVYMRTLAWHSLNSSRKSWVKTCVGLFSLEIGVFLFDVKLLGKDSTKLKFSLKIGVWHQLTLFGFFFKRQIRIISWRLFHAEKTLKLYIILRSNTFCNQTAQL